VEHDTNTTWFILPSSITLSMVFTKCVRVIFDVSKGYLFGLVIMEE